MKFDVYIRQDGCYVLMLQGSAALAGVLAMYGPMDFCETISEAQYPLPAIWATVHNELARYDHVVLPEAIGKKLMGLDCEDDHSEGARAAHAG